MADKKEFIRSEFWIMSWQASMPRPRKFYKPDASKSDRKKFQQDLIEFCKELLRQYKDKSVTESDHCKNIQKLADRANTYKDVLEEPYYNIGIAQKLLNLQLKYLWCMGKVKKPPHCPVDRNILNKTRLKDKCNWTEIDSIACYKKVIKVISEVATPMDIADWELCHYSRR